MGKHSRKKEKAVVDYRHRWPTQQTLYESRELNGGEPNNKPRSRRQDGIDHQVELIESRKQKQLSVSTLFESPETVGHTVARGKPGKSTHPYDTGVSDATVRDVEDTGERKPPSRRTERATSPREQESQTSDRLRKTNRLESNPSLPRSGTLGPKPPKNSGSNSTPESQAGSRQRSQNKIRFRSILKLNKIRGKTSNMSPSEDTSISPVQVETGADAPKTTRKRSWWQFKKQRRTRNEQDRGHSSSIAEGGNSLAALDKSRRTWKSIKARRTWGYAEGNFAANACENRTRGGHGKSGRGADQRQKVDKRSETTVYDTSPPQTDRGLWKVSGPKLRIRRRKSLSSSKARPSTTGTSSTPGTTTIHRDFVHEDSRETPSPMSPTWVLRHLLGSRKTPPSRPATQSDPRGPGISISTSTVALGRRSRDSHTSGRQSTDHKNRVWTPFWGIPRWQPERSQRDNVNET
ncbi:hypothetical protein F4776DRAFT_665387 [Hypoxylon sp. NC0597]|nr:hypothetical protein F4776DRAFT_665387 [Hypoxylon sp. NC0597]